MSEPKNAEEKLNQQTIEELYACAEGNVKDVPKFVSLFTEDGYFWDVAGGHKYSGAQLGSPVEVYDSAFPDMHRELHDLTYLDDMVVVELSLIGTHQGDLVFPAGTIPPTHKAISVPCCDVFHLGGGKVKSFHCYVAVPILLQQIGVFANIGAAFRK